MMQSAGEKLRIARLKKQLSFEQVYKDIKVHPNVLEALEQDRAHNFLSPVYLKGFLKKYAQYLELNAEALLKDYQDSQKPQTPEPETVAVVVEQKPKSALPVSPALIVRSVLAVFLAVGLIIYFRHLLQNISSRPDLEAPAEQLEVELGPVAKEAKPGELVLEVLTKEDCWIKVEADGDVLFQKTLLKGRVERWQAKEKLALRIGKPEALDMRLNGKLVDLKEVKAQKGLVITHQGVFGK